MADILKVAAILTTITKYHADLPILFLSASRDNIYILVQFLKMGGLPYVLNMALDQASSGHFENNAQNTK